MSLRMLPLLHSRNQNLANEGGITVVNDPFCVDTIREEIGDDRDAGFGLQMKVVKLLN
jgi:hypothetical protein